MGHVEVGSPHRREQDRHHPAKVVHTHACETDILIAIAPFPVDLQRATGGRLGVVDFLPSAPGLQETQAMLHELYGGLFYRVSEPRADAGQSLDLKMFDNDARAVALRWSLTSPMTALEPRHARRIFHWTASPPAAYAVERSDVHDHDTFLGKGRRFLVALHR